MAKKAESNLKNMLLALTLIALVASLALALVNNVTKGPIEKVNKEKVAKAVAKVLPAHDSYTVDTVTVAMEKGDAAMARYTATDANGSIVGKAIECFDPDGFGGKLTAMVGFDAEGNVTGYEILSSSETPGLGAKADKWFQYDSTASDGGRRTVIGKNLSLYDNEALSVSKDGGDIDAITGSTITSRAFCRLISNAYKAFKTEKGDIAQ